MRKDQEDLKSESLDEADFPEDDEIIGESEEGENELVEGEDQDDGDMVSDENGDAKAENADDDEKDLDEFPDEDNIESNIDTKRDKAITDLLKKEDLGLINMRLRENLKILSNFKDLRQKDKSRSQYMEELKADIHQAFDYNPSLVDMLFDLFAPAEALEFIEANDT